MHSELEIVNIQHYHGRNLALLGKTFFITIIKVNCCATKTFSQKCFNTLNGLKDHIKPLTLWEWTWGYSFSIVAMANYHKFCGLKKHPSYYFIVV